ncbi:MAG TPA: elongation factor P hydroxylase [Dongiaceae bacterium]|nr:elongation factor P hydroxylase [Dongiaceae bacterium]
MIALRNAVLNPTTTYHADDLIALFDQQFATSLNTRLVRGEHEPIYLPADDDIPYHRIVFAHGFFTSALHEVAHWCVAGPQRRLQVDFGYWYAPDGRSREQQQVFEQLEIKPQALEWIFNVAVGHRFRVSTDNLSGDGSFDPEGFKCNVRQEVLRRLRDGLPERARQFADALIAHYRPGLRLAPELFALSDL